MSASESSKKRTLPCSTRSPIVPATSFPSLKRKPNFCGDYHLAAPAFERSADQFLVPEGTIDLDCVEEGATWLDRAMQCDDRLRFVGPLHKTGSGPCSRDRWLILPIPDCQVCVDPNSYSALSDSNSSFGAASLCTSDMIALHIRKNPTYDTSLETDVRLEDWVRCRQTSGCHRSGCPCRSTADK